MTDAALEKTNSPFPNIQTDMIDRLAQEADERTLQPMTVDWKEIHRQAALSRK